MANSKGVKKEHTNHKFKSKQYAKKQIAIAKLNEQIPAKTRLMINRWFKRFDKTETDKRLATLELTESEERWLYYNNTRLTNNQITATEKRKKK